MIKIRRSDDLELIAELEREIFYDTVKMDDSDMAATDWWVAMDGDVPVGFAGVRMLPAEGKAFLALAGVTAVARGKGLQKRLIRVRTRHAKRHLAPRCYTYVKSTNHASMRSLISCGFKPYYTAKCEIGTIIYFENQRKG